MRVKAQTAAATVCLTVLVGCGLDGPASNVPTEQPGPRALIEADAPERPTLCARPGADAIRDAFCSDTRPVIGDLRALQDLLDVRPVPHAPGQSPQLAAMLDPSAVISNVVVLGHSTALGAKLVSPINPRVIIVGGETQLTFQRGVQQIELASRAREDGSYRFYLLRFTQACNERAEGCSPGDLFTPQIERDWTSVAIFDEEDLANTPLDCRQCHQRGRARSVLLMRELESPWTHFFERALFSRGGAPGVRGADLVTDFLAAKGDESYAGVPASMFRQTSAAILENLVPRDQPLLFDTRKIEEERFPHGPGGYPAEPRASATWDTAYEAFRRGEQLALPYLEQRATDPEKQARLTALYRRYVAGQIRADELPDLSDIFPDDPSIRARIGLQTEPDATPAETLVQACGSCHNDVLDQRLSRARFNIDLSRLDRRELSVAIERIERPRGTPGAMPPSEARQLDPQARTALLAFLKQASVASQPDALLQRAAKLGMGGGGLRPSADR